jgi:hypothetical protein
MSEGILAPRTPVPPPSPFRASTMPLPPRSPISRLQELDVPSYSSPMKFKLDVPPRRSNSQSSDAGLGISGASLRKNYGKSD